MQTISFLCSEYRASNLRVFRVGPSFVEYEIDQEIRGNRVDQGGRIDLVEVCRGPIVLTSGMRLPNLSYSQRAFDLEVRAGNIRVYVLVDEDNKYHRVA